MRYKLKVPLSNYRKWSQALEELGVQLQELSDFEKKMKLDAFKSQLCQELEPLLRSEK